jgi:hypothetical protein
MVDTKIQFSKTRFSVSTLATAIELPVSPALSINLAWRTDEYQIAYLLFTDNNYKAMTTSGCSVLNTNPLVKSPLQQPFMRSKFLSFTCKIAKFVGFFTGLWKGGPAGSYQLGRNQQITHIGLCEELASGCWKVLRVRITPKYFSFLINLDCIAFFHQWKDKTSKFNQRNIHSLPLNGAD